MGKARLLDLTRSMRRVGRMATGIDRVEQAYLQQFLALDTPVYGIVRTTIGYLLLDRAGMEQFRNRVLGHVNWGQKSLLSRFGRKSEAARRAESDMRRLAVARARRGRLPQMLERACPDGFDYFNVGHSNLTDRMLQGVKDARGRIHVLIHDVIPLEFPEFQRPGSVVPFKDKLARVKKFADQLIYNSADTRERAERYLADMGRVPDGITAHLGVNVAVADAKGLPQDLPPLTPYFVTIGTIEPRKNHAFLLDLWEELGPDAPMLLIIGNRGWNNADVFERLDRIGPSARVRECNDLSDNAVAELVQSASGALFPSLAEGFGLPMVECIALGARVFCNNLPVFQEIAGEKAVYLPVSDRYLWLNKIKELGKSQPDAQGQPNTEVPQWSDHFKIVLRLN